MSNQSRCQCVRSNSQPIKIKSHTSVWDFLFWKVTQVWLELRQYKGRKIGVQISSFQLLSCDAGNLDEMDVNIILLINRKERDELIKMGVKLGYGGVSCTHSRHSGVTYYMCESPWNMEKLNAIRERVKIK